MGHTTLDFNDEKTISIITQFAEELPGGFFIYKATGNEEFIYINSAMLRIFGCQTKQEFLELTKNSFHTMVHPDDIDAVEKSISAQIESSVHDLDYVEYRIIRKDGEVRWIVDYGHFLHTETLGDVFFVFIDDATETHKLELEERRKKSVIEGLSSGFNSIYLINMEKDNITPYVWNSPIGKEIVDEVFNNAFSSQSYTQMTKYFAEKYIVPKEQGSYLETVCLENIRKKNKLGHEISQVFGFNHNNENPEYVQISIYSVKENPSLAVMGIKTVTEQMQKIQSETMERIKIEQERDEAIHANNAKSIFLFNMSHDLKTPINAISGFAELAQKNIDSDRKKLLDYLEKIVISSNLLVELINDVLGMTEIESGNMVLKETPCNLSEQLVLLGDIFKPQITAKNLNYSISLKIKHNLIVADSLNLKRILTNIIQNSVNYTPHGGNISLDVYELLEPNLETEIYKYQFIISDTGCGMSKDFMEKMYNAFEREQNTTTSHIAGTGLGLTITKSLVEAMHGTIEAKSEPKKGTTFIITIPFSVQGKHPIEENLPPPQEEKSEKTKKRVLLAEDNELNREIAEELLHEVDFSVESAIDGQHALEIFTSHPEYYFDLILMDIQMPRMDGYEATKAIRALPREDVKTIPIYAITANTLDSDKVRAYESGMNAVIEKPVSIDLFSKMLLNV